MLSNKQCVEVVEKVWGWKSSRVPSQFQDVWWMFDGNRMLKQCDLDSYGKLAAEVNSWSGFGSTVEAMAVEYNFGNDGGVVWFEHKIRAGYFSHSISNEFDVSNFISATHLAALDAIKEK